MTARDNGSPDRVPPYDLDVERSLLGAMMLSAEAIAAAGELTASDFYEPGNAQVFLAIRALHSAGKATEPDIVADQLRLDGLLDRVGGVPKLVAIAAKCPAASAASSYVDILRRHTDGRRIIEAARAADVAARKGDNELANKLLAEALADTSAAPSSDLFKLWTPAQLVDADLAMRWSVRGWLADPTYGQIAGEMKTLKSYIASFVKLSVATNRPLFGRFEVDRGGPVVGYVGEGGRKLYIRRLARIAHAMGVDLSDADLHTSFDVAPIGGVRFQQSLARDLDELSPQLVVVDPLYAFHGTSTNAANLHEEGALLSSLSAPCIERDASLYVVNHFNQTGTGGGLKRITQAGSGEWADSWVLVSHREAPDVEGGNFRLLLDVGSRQWGGTTWDLDLSIGRLDPDTGTHDGDIEWNIARHVTSGAGPSDRLADAILDVLNDHPWEKTKTEVLELVGGNKDNRRAAFDALDRAGKIRMRCLPRHETRATQNRELWARADQLAPDEL